MSIRDEVDDFLRDTVLKLQELQKQATVVDDIALAYDLGSLVTRMLAVLVKAGEPDPPARGPR